MLSTVSRPGAGIKSMKSVPRKVVVGRIFDFFDITTGGRHGCVDIVTTKVAYECACSMKTYEWSVSGKTNCWALRPISISLTPLCTAQALASATPLFFHARSPPRPRPACTIFDSLCSDFRSAHMLCRRRRRTVRQHSSVMSTSSLITGSQQQQPQQRHLFR